VYFDCWGTHAVRNSIIADKMKEITQGGKGGKGFVL
jgi:hypothetical protein